MALTADFERGINGNTVTTAVGEASLTKWDGVFTGPTYDNTVVSHGSLSTKIANGSSRSFQWNTSISDFYCRTYLYLSSATVGIGGPIWNSAVGFITKINANNTLRIQDSGSNLRDTTTVIPPGQWIRIELHVFCSTTVGQMELKLFTNPDSSTPTETITSPATWNTGTSSADLRFGSIGSVGTDMWLDQIVGGATAYPGPFPVNSATPILTGSANVGQTLFCDSGSWNGTFTLTYQWTRDGSNIPGATSSSYTLTATDLGRNIACSVTATGIMATNETSTVSTGSMFIAPHRLPVIGGDANNWGSILTDYLLVSQNYDGSLRHGYVDYQYFTSSGTWNKPATATFVRAVCIGSGGGGGGGLTNVSGTGGGGGGGAGVSVVDFRATDLPRTVSIFVDQGGSGGGIGQNGTDGKVTMFGSLVRAGGGGGGGTGIASLVNSPSGGGASSSNSGFLSTAGVPAATSNTDGSGAQGVFQPNGNAGRSAEWGGGSGGGCAAGTTRNGGSSIFGGAGGGSGAFQGNGVGAIGGTTQSYTNGGGGAAGASNGGTGTNGTLFIGPFCGSAGGGGGSSLTQAGGNGGNGGIGSGGGGGGSSTVIAGIGGNGGPGRCIIISW